MSDEAKYMKTILPLALIALAVFYISCDARPLAVVPSGNPDINLVLIFEHDGCKGYRFEDSGYTHYYVTCPAATTTTTNMVGGKHKHTDDIAAVTK